ncbi:DUF4352 domain-containing protein [Mycobacterium kansasii]|uniref:DUF4352 domain-containing protein n=3 Tax=Mycobacterium kansasii TaxID=1768 RepID=A0A1V3X6V5_MYCKA|nr:DUF4352 domain-containing protein [Mycobacterium kansasii]ETZ97846.1 hypothetical protein I547_6687 [Mycobacterium kansasii 824]AGZ50711.1 phage resistance protein [Mycobacterium kansasii ATCC 12478]ARG57495.1 hypothetical protein B1T43_18320 [Mycobacterium kansasii]ARG63000.1 hypothetical protein B1T45_18715 [Mycobacterium kansasii]ARG70618.1 hypothetical protein B1T47_17960 [Mycobacterium kansasii]
MPENQPPSQPPFPPTPPGGYYGPPPGYYQPPRKKRKVWPWVLLGVFVLFFGGCFAFLGVIGSAVHSSSEQRSSERAAASAPSAAMPGIGQEVRDGKFAFTVTGVTRASSVGTTQARGEFVIVAMTVKNTGDQPQDYFSSNQKLFDTAGREFAADPMAIAKDSMVVNLNPGFDLNVKVPFDVPAGTTIATIELHDSAFSNGARVRLK